MEAALDQRWGAIGRKVVDVVAQLTRSEAEDFLYREARLVDERRFEDWFDLFTQDAHYWIPNQKGGDPREESPIAYDDMETLKDRIWRLRSPAAHSQNPGSRTRHIISNVEVGEEKDGLSLVYSNFVIFEVRLGEERSVAGHYEHHLRKVGGEWRIALKKVWLINRDLPIYNLTFLI